jgi:hypothetical protein
MSVVKRPTKTEQISETISKAEQISDSVQTITEMAVQKAKSKSKTNAVNIDLMLNRLIHKFNLNVKDVKTEVFDLLPANSSFKKKQKKEGPKKPTSAYMCFIKENREKVKTEDPTLTFTTITKKLGAMWKALTPEQKVHYVERYKIDQGRYKKEKDEFNAKKASEAAANVESGSSAPAPVKKTRAKKADVSSTATGTEAPAKKTRAKKTDASSNVAPVESATPVESAAAPVESAAPKKKVAKKVAATATATA